MRAYVPSLLFALVPALLIPISASAQTGVGMWLDRGVRDGGWCLGSGCNVRPGGGRADIGRPKWAFNWRVR